VCVWGGGVGLLERNTKEWAIRRLMSLMLCLTWHTET
jgi:hypothetical protein